MTDDVSLARRRRAISFDNSRERPTCPERPHQTPTFAESQAKQQQRVAGRLGSIFSMYYFFMFLLSYSAKICIYFLGSMIPIFSCTTHITLRVVDICYARSPFSCLLFQAFGVSLLHSNNFRFALSPGLLSYSALISRSLREISCDVALRRVQLILTKFTDP